ncbi:SpoIID/LytB domain-containing protein [Paenibacillus sp. HB172176]|uniref:SpoIID/LytB domain-containing protein n=1 Tax=Paenibacillus sp. HB172176 TaxID=2493690 RepID=UPI001438C442|nr:SpoIID/LytB domain-containing protein [Paenibacillus sp. HB172176]
MRTTGKRRMRLLLASTALLLLISSWNTPSSEAAAPGLDTIRVAMFLNLPGKYESITSAATFSSAGGLKVSIRRPNGDQEWFPMAAGKPAKFALDDYKVKVFETSNFASAYAMYTELKASGGLAYLTSMPRKNGLNYQVLEGDYGSAADAGSALGRWAGNGKLSSLSSGMKPQLQGPFHLESAALGSKAEAEAAVLSFGNAGLDAFVAVRSSGAGKLAYSVMVGAASSAEELKQVQAAASALPLGATLNPVADDSAYLLLRQDFSTSSGGSQSMELMQFPSNETKLWISSTGDQPIGLSERYNRTYRGGFELSSFNNKLAVVNELPFEEYLYSVVAVEMYSSWPLEALKAQAVAARSFVLSKGFTFQIAHVVDTTLSQAYSGTGVEQAASTEAVNETNGEVMLYDGKPIEALYSSNGGGMTADAIEAWGTEVPYLKSVQSPDESAEEGLLHWYYVQLPDGKLGYIREDLVQATGEKTKAGSEIVAVLNDTTNVRKNAMIQDSVPVLEQVKKGTRAIVLDKVMESNPMNWKRGPYTSEQMLGAINARLSEKLSSPITSIAVSRQGVSGRATEIAVNGKPLAGLSPDSLRSVLGAEGSLPSTKFAIEETGRLVVQGAGGKQQQRDSNNQKLYLIGAEGTSSALKSDIVYVMDKDHQVRAATKEPGFAFHGQGYGHGAGMSQYGAYSLAGQGYGYEYILKYYYKDITLAKE